VFGAILNAIDQLWSSRLEEKPIMCAESTYVGLRMLKTRSRCVLLDENNCLAMGLGTIRGLPTAASLPGKGMIAVGRMEGGVSR